MGVSRPFTSEVDWSSIAVSSSQNLLANLSSETPALRTAGREEDMTKINFGRLFVGGLVASVLLFLSDGFLHEQVFKEYWGYLYQGLGAKPPESHATAMVYFFIFELGRGFLAIFIYALMRPFYGPGPKTAVLSA